jgi:hypothetical membrane protein
MVGLSGILCPVAAIVTLSIAIIYAPWFSFTENALSNLAGFGTERSIWAAFGTASVVFNIGLVVTGLFAVLFSTGLGANFGLTTFSGRLGRLVFLLGSSSLAAIGMFPETFGQIHDLFSVSFFLLVPVGMILIGISVLTTSYKTTGWFIIILAIIAVSPQFIPWRFEGQAIPDLISIAAMGTFTCFGGIRLLKKTSTSHDF